MKIAKEHSELEKAVREVEMLMDKYGLSITSYGGNGFTISMKNFCNDSEFWVQERGGQRSTSFPRICNDEVFVMMEDW